MKKFIGIFAFLMIALAAFVSAAPAITVTDINLGGSTAQRSNPLADSDSKHDVYVEGTITIKNTGDEPVSSIAAVFTPETGYTANDLNATVTLAATALPVGNTTTAAVKVRVPQHLDGIDSAFTETGMNVAKISVTGTSNATSTQLSAVSTVNLQAKNMLNIDDIDLVIKGAETRTESGKNDKTIKDIKPGDIVEMTIIASNEFRDSDNIDMEDVLVNVLSQNSEFDVDEEDSISSLSPKEKNDEVVITFEVDSDQEKGGYDVVISVDGEDENGARHGEKWTMTFNVDRKSHEIQVRSAALMPESANAGGSTELKVTMRNIGKHDEEEVTLAIAAPELKFGEILNKLKISENDDLAKRFTIPVPEGLAAGNYRIDIKTYYNNDQESDTVTVLLKVLAAEEKKTASPCEGVSCQDTSKICADGFVATCVNTCDAGKCSQCTPSCEGHSVVVPPLTGVTGGAVTEPPAEEKSEISPLYIGGLVAVNLFVLLIGIFVIVKLAKK